MKTPLLRRQDRPLYNLNVTYSCERGRKAQRYPQYPLVTNITSNCKWDKTWTMKVTKCSVNCFMHRLAANLNTNSTHAAPFYRLPEINCSQIANNLSRVYQNVFGTCALTRQTYQTEIWKKSTSIWLMSSSTRGWNISAGLLTMWPQHQRFSLRKTESLKMFHCGVCPMGLFHSPWTTTNV